MLGRVVKPDLYTLKPNDRVLDAFTRAGGAGPEADISQAVLVRRDEQGEPLRRKLDLKKIMQTGNLKDNELMRAGDVLFIRTR